MFVYLGGIGDAGSPHTRFRLALRTGNVHLIETAALELPQIGLQEALSILVVLARTGDRRYERAAAKWAARAASERKLTLAESRRVLALVEVLPEAPDAVAESLASFCRTR